MDIDQRISQFEKMAAEDAENDMAHFSLGNAYMQAGRFPEAAGSFRRSFELNPAMTKAYEKCGAALMAADRGEEAILVLQEGYAEAASRGDLMPKRAMKEMLEKLGGQIPEVDESKVEAIPEGSFVDRRTGRAGTQLPRPPFRGPIGQWIYDNISKESFDEWIGQGTKVINELRLDLSRTEDELVYDQHMREFLGIDDEMYEQLTGERPPATRL